MRVRWRPPSIGFGRVPSTRSVCTGRRCHARWALRQGRIGACDPRGGCGGRPAPLRQAPSRQMANRTAVVAKATAGWTRLKTAQSASSLKSHVSTTTSVVRQQTATPSSRAQPRSAPRWACAPSTRRAVWMLRGASRYARRPSRAALGKADAAYQGVCRMAGPHARATLMAFNQSVKPARRRRIVPSKSAPPRWVTSFGRCGWPSSQSGCAAPNARLDAPPSSSASSWTLWCGPTACCDAIICLQCGRRMQERSI